MTAAGNPARHWPALVPCSGWPTGWRCAARIEPTRLRCRSCEARRLREAGRGGGVVTSSWDIPPVSASCFIPERRGRRTRARAAGALTREDRDLHMARQDFLADRITVGRFERDVAAVLAGGAYRPVSISEARRQREAKP